MANLMTALVKGAATGLAAGIPQVLLTQAEARLLALPGSQADIFSPWGVATQTGTERPVETRPTRETLLHWTAALTFSLTLAYLYPRLERWPVTKLAPAVHWRAKG